jgi:hypothetical protein
MMRTCVLMLAWALKATLLSLTLLAGAGICLAQGTELELKPLSFHPTVRSRRPVAAVTMPEGRLLVANERSGTVSLVDPDRRGVLNEWDIGERLVDVTAIDGTHFGFVDHAAHQWIVAELTAGELVIRQRLPVAAWPICAVKTSSDKIVVASLWSRSLTWLRRAAQGEWRSEESLRLTFNPRLLLALPGGKLLVVDAFGGQIAVVNVAEGRVESQRTLAAHNIRGMTMTPDGACVLLTHQQLDEDAATTHSNVSLGIVLSNLVRQIPLSALLDPSASLEQESSRIFLGRTLEGAADPNGIAFEKSGDVLIALGGTDEVLRMTPDGDEIERIRTGHRPTGLIRVGDRIAVLENLGDAVGVIDDAAHSAVEIPLGPHRELTRAERGEIDFHNGRLSLESWMSCHSCHPDGHSNGLLADTSSDGSLGTPKRVLSLLGTRDANPWAWNGGMRELHEQVSKSVTTSMQGEPIPLDRQIDLVAFLHSLPPAPPLVPSTSDDDRQEIEHGKAVFRNLGCATCHVPPLTYTSDATYDVGMPDEHGQAKFNPPTLRGVSQRDHLFHDSRAVSLEEVIDVVGHQLSRTPTAVERRDLLRFLKSL